ncbi:MAG: DUF4340 domain-containing protein, partial [Leptonema sp. (in: Bacteria)]|nr:DUF4340 domain-containing protein [Leptonema sp. (in: bacteria)]
NYFKDELCFELLTGVKAKPQIFCKGKETQSITYSRLLNTPNHVYLVPVTMFQFYGKPPTELFERRVFVLPTATVVSQIVVELPTKSKIEFSRTVIKSSDGKIEKISWFQIDSNGNSQSIESVQIDNLLSILFDLQKHKFLSKSEEQSLPPPVPAYQISIDTVIESPFEKNPFGNQNIGKTKINVKIVKAASNYFVESRDGFDQLDTEQLQLLDAKLSQLSL